MLQLGVQGPCDHRLGISALEDLSLGASFPQSISSLDDVRSSYRLVVILDLWVLTKSLGCRLTNDQLPWLPILTPQTLHNTFILQVLVLELMVEHLLLQRTHMIDQIRVQT
jgi:hypothetical protein